MTTTTTNSSMANSSSNPTPPAPPPPSLATHDPTPPKQRPAQLLNIALFGATGNLARHLISTLLSLSVSSPHARAHARSGPSSLMDSVGQLVLFTRADPHENALLRRWMRTGEGRVRVVRWREAVVGGEGGEGVEEGGGDVEVIGEEAVARNLRRYEVGGVVNCLSPAAGRVREVVVGGIALANRERRGEVVGVIGRDPGDEVAEGDLMKSEGGTGRKSGRWGGVELYFPPEFGLDECVGGERDEQRDSDGGEYQAQKRRAMASAGVSRGDDLERPYARYFEVPEWQLKQSHYDFASAQLDRLGVKIVSLQIGLFLNAIGPWFGFHTARGMYSVVGDPKMRMAWTDLGDVARVILALVRKVYDGESVPVRVRIAGCVASPEEIRDEMQEAGGREIMLRSGTEINVFRERALARKVEERSPIPFIRLIMADGFGDYRSMDEGGWGNDNEYVNPGESVWRWKGIEELARQTKGRPNAGF